jgi:hypothetical protein
MERYIESSSKHLNASDRRTRLRQAAAACAGLGSLVLLNTFFAELGSRSQPLQAVELASGTVFALISAVLLSLDIQVRRFQFSIWLARLLLLPSVWGIIALVRAALGPQAALMEVNNFPRMAQAAALVNAALMSVIVVLLVRAGFAQTGPAASAHDSKGN